MSEQELRPAPRRNPAKKATRLRTWLRRILWSFAGLIVLITLALTVLLYTRWGKAQLLEYGVDKLNASIPGHLSVDELSGPLLEEATLTEVSLRSEGGKELLHIDRITSSYTLRALLDDKVMIGDLSVDGVALMVSETPTGLDLIHALVAPGSDEVESGESAWVVDLDKVSVTDSSILYRNLEGQELTIERLSIQAEDILSAGNDLSLGLTELSGYVPRCERNVTLRADEIKIENQKLVAKALRITSGASELAWPVVEMNLETGGFELGGEGVIDTSLLQCLLPEQVWLQDIAVALRAERESQDRALDVDIQASAGESRLTIAAQGFPENKELTVNLSLAKLHMHELMRMEHQSALAGQLAFRVSDWNGGGLWAVASGTLAGAIDGYLIDEVQVGGTNKGKRFAWNLGVTTGGEGAQITSKGTLDWSRERLRISRGSAELNAPDLRRAAQGRAPIAGDLSGSLTFKGPVSGLKTEGNFKSDSARYDKIRVRASSLSFEFDELGTSYVGDLHLASRRAWHEGQPIGSLDLVAKPNDTAKVVGIVLAAGSPRFVKVDARAVATLGEGTGRIDLDRLIIRRRDVRLAGNQGSLSWYQDGDVEVENLALRSAAGTLRVDGRLSEGIKSTLVDVDLGTLRSGLAFGKIPRKGRVGGTVVVARRDGRLDVDTNLSASALEFESVFQNASATFRSTASRNGLKLSLDVQAKQLGHLEATASAKRPRDLFATQRWKRMGTDALRSAELNFQDFHISALSTLLGGAKLSGRVNGSLTLGKRAQEANGSVSFAEIAREGIDLSVGGTVDLTAEGKMVVLRGHLQDSELGRITLAANLLPQGLLGNLKSWSQAPASVVDSLVLEFEKIELGKAEALLALEKRPRIERGRLTGAIRIEDKGETLLADFALADLRALGRGPLQSKFHFESRGHQASYTLGAQLAGALSLSSSGAVDRGWHDALANPRRTLDRAVVDASLEGASKDLTRALRTAEVKPGRTLGGAASFRADLKGGLQSPVGSATVSVLKAQVDAVPIGNLRLQVGYENDRWSANLISLQTGAGKLNVTAVGSVEKQRADSVVVKGKNYDLSVLRKFSTSPTGVLSSVAGKLSADFSISDPMESAEMLGTMSVEDARLHFGGALMPLEGVALKLRGKRKSFKMEGSGRSGEGSFTLTGGGRFDKGELRSTKVNLEFSRLPVAAGAIVYSVDGKASALISHRPGMWMVNATIDEGLVRVPINSFGGSEYSLHPVDGLSDVNYVSSVDLPPGLRQIESRAPVARIKISAPDTLRIRSEDAEAIANLDLDITFLGSTPVIHGQAEVTRGRVAILNRLYTIERAVVAFGGRIPINPSLDIQLRHDFETLRLDVIVGGTAEEPLLHFESDPADYDQSSLLAITLGQAPGKAGDVNQLENQAIGVASNVAINALQVALGTMLPVSFDVMRIEPTENAGNSYVVGDWLTDDWFVAYRYHPGATVNDNVSEMASEYQLGKKWRIDSTVGISGGKHGADILWIHRWGK